VTFTSHQIDARISPFNNDKEKKLLPLINPRPLVDYGKGDRGIQAYCFRLIATNRPENMVRWKKPKNYDPKTYELMRRYYRLKPEAPPLIGFWQTLPNGKSDINSGPGLSTNLLDGSSWDYPEADYKKRDSIWQWHMDYTLGLAWFLSTDSAVPQRVRDEVKAFGMCKDEYVDNDHFPYQLYVREARRMKGMYFMTAHDLQEDTVKYDAIGMSAYNMDVREMQRNYIEISRFPDMNFEAYNEGYLSIPVAKYQIPYRSIVPKIAECANLIVPVCVSGSHLAFASLRMEPTYMIMGESAGVAAAMSVKTGRPVQLLDVVALQEKLTGYRQVLSIDENPYGLLNTMNEIIIDNNIKGFTTIFGDWREEETVHNTGRYAMNFRYKPEYTEAEFEYNPYFFKSGSYEVYIVYPSDKRYANSVPIEIVHAKGTSIKTVNQQSGGGQWVNLGRYHFKKGQHTALRIKGEQGKYVVADAVKFVYADN
jgi:hypothetical protein